MRVQLTTWLAGVPAICIGSVLVGRRLWNRLEAIDTPAAGIAVGASLSSAARTRPQHPFWMLAKKEIHLQQLTLVIVALYASIGVIAAVAQRGGRASSIPLAPVTVVYMLLIGVLIGALASAEERHYGTLEWQTLMPVPA